jgi:hypothetical protein
MDDRMGVSAMGIAPNHEASWGTAIQDCARTAACVVVVLCSAAVRCCFVP